MASLRWKNYSACLALLLERVSCLPSRRPLLPMLPPNPYLQMSAFRTVFLTKRDYAGKIECMFDLEGSVRLEVLYPLTSQAPRRVVPRCAHARERVCSQALWAKASASEPRPP